MLCEGSALPPPRSFLIPTLLDGVGSNSSPSSSTSTAGSSCAPASCMGGSTYNPRYNGKPESLLAIAIYMLCWRISSFESVFGSVAGLLVNLPVCELNYLVLQGQLPSVPSDACLVDKPLKVLEQTLLEQRRELIHSQRKIRFFVVQRLRQ